MFGCPWAHPGRGKANPPLEGREPRGQREAGPWDEELGSQLTRGHANECPQCAQTFISANWWQMADESRLGSISLRINSFCLSARAHLTRCPQSEREPLALLQVMNNPGDDDDDDDVAPSFRAVCYCFPSKAGRFP